MVFLEKSSFRFGSVQHSVKSGLCFLFAGEQEGEAGPAAEKAQPAVRVRNAPESGAAHPAAFIAQADKHAKVFAVGFCQGLLACNVAAGAVDVHFRCLQADAKAGVVPRGGFRQGDIEPVQLQMGLHAQIVHQVFPQQPFEKRFDRFFFFGNELNGLYLVVEISLLWYIRGRRTAMPGPS